MVNVSLHFIVVMELNKMINPNSQKMSFDIKLPHDPQSNCNKFITKGYSMSVSLMNISITIGITLGIVFILLSQINTPKMMKQLFKQNISDYKNI